MPRIDPKIVEEYFSAHYSRGVILRFLMDCDDPNVTRKPKFAILLNKDSSEPEAILAITTSRVEKFASSFLDPDVLRIPSGAYPAFPKATVIDLRELKVVSRSGLMLMGVSQQMSFEGRLTDDDMMEIDHKLSASKLIERGLKRRIV